MFIAKICISQCNQHHFRDVGRRRNAAKSNGVRWDGNDSNPKSGDAKKLEFSQNREACGVRPACRRFSATGLVRDLSES
jgi:hypothetical protein